MPLHKIFFVSLHKNIVVGAILYGCPELPINFSRGFRFKKRKLRLSNGLQNQSKAKALNSNTFFTF
ncbi:MAG: hypothetical protein KAI83_19865 [Thiomargarita sp.]|nr:hypothetical protein [Thiomargarita sp.]